MICIDQIYITLAYEIIFDNKYFGPAKIFKNKTKKILQPLDFLYKNSS